jgi:hypothetical protein
MGGDVHHGQGSMSSGAAFVLALEEAYAWGEGGPSRFSRGSAQRLFPRKAIYCCFPFNRQSLELKSLALKSFKVAKERYARHQFPDPVMLPDGRRVSKPAGW